ncbi:MAG: methyltransferase [Gordonia sp. (in: high G+C Gram-positive bacteria)]|uniref:class I SAM-dependent methyltransferase n=1 Tax=Gordonia sp. (in: high G+C Gram-positive bacteria) TaxID=84139 RepID=UPI0039E27BE9
MDLRRFPDVEGPGLQASDAADRLLLDETAPLRASTAPGRLVVVDDSYGALTLGAVSQGAGEVRVHQDLITGERALAANARRLSDTLSDGGFTSLPLAPETFDGATAVLLRLPRSLDRLAEVSAMIAAHADPTVTVAAGGRIKHMSTSMNDVLLTVFDRVDVSRARQKSRMLTATGPRRDAALDAAARWPRTETHRSPTVPDGGLVVAAHGGVFAGTGIDIGTRFLLEQVGAMPEVSSALDLACGTGIVAAVLALTRPGLTVTATDRSAAAAASAAATARLSGVDRRVDVVRADGTETLAASSQPLILLNPPFHSDAAVSTGIAGHLFADAARALAPGGELWCVWNSHLRYRPALERIVGPTRQVARNAKFTITASTRL